MAALQKVLVIFSGFRQSGRQFNGLTALLKRCVASILDNRANVYWLQYEWNADVESIAEWLQVMKTEEVIIVGYSWGAGRAARQLAYALDNRGILVRNMILSDPVKFTALLVFRWIALARLMKSMFPIIIPSSVERCTYFTQNSNVPSGFPVRFDRTGNPEWDYKRASRITHVNLNGKYLHEEMDNAVEFHDAVIAALEAFYPPTDRAA